MTAWTPSAWGPRALTPSTLTPAALGTSSASVDPYAYLADDFTDETEADPLNRGWSYYKDAAVNAIDVNNGALQIEILQGGTGATGSLWYTQDAANEFDGFLVYKDIGPASGTAVSFDVRARLVALNTAENGDPPAGGDYRYVVLAAHDPSRTDLNYIHVGIGRDPAGLQIEVKTTDGDGVTAQSVFPVVAAVSSTPGLFYDVRIVRRRSDPQIFDCYYRATGSQLLTSNLGWTLHTTIDRSDDTVPARAVAVPLPDDLEVGIGVYSNTVVHDIHGRCIGFVALPTNA